METTTIRSYGFTRDSYSARNGLVELTDVDLRSSASSIFADEAWTKMSKRYKFIPTIQVVDWLRQEGFLPVRAAQGRTRIEGKKAFTKHMVRFRRKEDLDTPLDRVGREFPEVTLVNSHDGTSSYQLYLAVPHRMPQWADRPFPGSRWDLCAAQGGG